MEYKLVFEDHFDGDELNLNNWTIDTTGHGHGNNELQHYTDREKNVFIKDSLLHLVAYKEPFKHRSYTSGKINSKNKVDVGYGKIEVKAKLPTGKGTWPAVWMLGKNISEVGWPLCGEIDILETVYRLYEKMHFSLHSKTYNHKIKTHITHVEEIKGIYEGFHLYTIIWEPEFISYYIDDKHYITFNKSDLKDQTIEGWPFIPPFYLIVNFALGGYFGGPIDDSIFPQTFYIDYIRVYERIK